MAEFMDTEVYIAEKIGEPALMEQLAEECAELAHASLKLARILRGDNYTPVKKEEAIAALEEEIGDVTLLCSMVRKRFHLCDPARIWDVKLPRWVRRIRGEDHA